MNDQFGFYFYSVDCIQNEMDIITIQNIKQSIIKMKLFE